jgi:GH15 family glucan-1,4-alpha-glucosidase
VVHQAIGDYAVIGDCRSAALVSSGGSIDWLCLPQFDSPSMFASILDQARGGCFRIRPANASTSTRRYVADSNVLETTFSTASGVVRVTDLMPVDSESAKARELWPEHEILRRIECLDGDVEVEVVFDPRFDYGRVTPTIKSRAGVFYAEQGPAALTLRTDLQLRPARARQGLAGTAVITAGERRYLSMTYAHGMPAVIASIGQDADSRIDRSIRWWNDWAAACRYTGPCRDAVVRSALVLKLLSYAPSGPSSPRRPRRCQSASAASGTGTTGTAGCATHP